ncbi:cupin domain-containing protein [uncultured Stenotrophomonas sp.]|uniref:cupin domain-containing protein n=1 Tax=uncultured Stenotrophomonas sp. TaxID=165438 RepID=UPI0028EA29A6|nr:cupin domain-containing protein [uncultured Stenotrophomonas sp.]
MSASRHVRSLWTATTVHDDALGSIRRLNADDFPLLERMSIKRMLLAPGSIREPHWHANANELGYVLAGSVLITIVGNADAVSTLRVRAGEMFHIESGALHAIENIGDDSAELVIVFGHERPQDFSLHAAFGAMSDAVLGNTYDMDSVAFSTLPRDTGSPYLVKRSGPPVVPDEADRADPHRFDIEAQSPPVDFPYGQARVSRTQFWPALRNLSMYSLRIADDGMREPHWHPETAELGYVHRGQARMSILDPDGSVDTYLLQPGDVYFIPRAYPHQIEVLGEDVHFLVFFDQPTPGDVGYRLAATAFAPGVLAATFGVDAAALPTFPRTVHDPLIVARRNALDPVSR